MGILLLGAALTVVTGFSQRSVINMNFLSFNLYPMINAYLPASGNTTPVGATWATTTSVYGGAIDANGWPNIAEANGKNFGGSFGMPGPDEFNGAYVFQWQGDGRVSVQLGNVTWTETNYVTPGGVTITNGNQNIPWTNTFSAGQCIILDTTIGNLSALTSYYVSSAGLTGSNIRLADTKAHAIAGTNTITPSAGGSSNLYGPYQKFGANGGWMNTQGARGSDARVIATPSGTTGPQSVQFIIAETDKYSLGSYVKDVLVYRLEDETDLLAGKIFRTKWKQPLVDLNPSAIRFMPWESGGIPPTPCRFEHRGLPLTSGWSGAGNDFLSSPVYASNLSGTNALTLAAATPTGSNPKTTPVSDFHGEIVTCRMAASNNSVRSGQKIVTAITNANPGVVTTSVAHGFSTGDKIVHVIPGNMPRLNFFPVTITVTSSTQYSIGVDTTSFGTFNGSLFNQYCCQFLTLAVGGRRAYQIMQPDGFQPEGYQGNGINFSDSTTGNISFFFDKTSAAETDGTAATFTGSISGTTLTVSSVTGVIAIGQTLGADTGGVAGGTKIVSGSGTTWTVNNSQTTSSRAMNSVGWIYGAWLWNYQGNSGMVPLEMCTAMINEINDMSIAQGISGLVGMWVVAPVRALMVTDPDYTTASDWGLGMADVVINPASTLRYAGFSNLTHSAPAFFELANEVWNLTMVHSYIGRRQGLRWPGSSEVPTDMQAFMSSTMMKTIKAAYPTSQIKGVLAGWAIGGINSAGLIDNAQLISGSNTLSGDIAHSPGYNYTTDPYVISNSYGTPISNHDAFAIAPYYDPSGDYAGSVVTCQFQSGVANVQSFGMVYAVNQKIIFSAGGSGLPSNVTAGTVYKVTSSSGVPGNVVFAFSTLGGTPVVPNATATGQGVVPTGQGTFLDDNAMYNGTDNTANNGANYTGAANTAQAITNFVNHIKSNSGGGIDTYCDNSGNGLVKGFAAVLNPLGKSLINYEGGFDWACDISTPGNGVTYFNGTVQIDAPMAAFLTAVMDSSQWSTAQLGYFNNCASLVPGTAMQGVFVNIGVGTRRWSYAFPDSFSGTTEGLALSNNPTWAAMGARNRALAS